MMHKLVDRRVIYENGIKPAVKFMATQPAVVGRVVLAAALLSLSACVGHVGAADGSDPQAPGDVLAGSDSDMPPADTRGTEDVTLVWNAPTTNVDATPLTGLAGYRLYYGQATGTYATEADLGMPSCTGSGVTEECTYTVTSVGAGTWYFVVTAYDTGDVESGYSNEVVHVIP